MTEQKLDIIIHKLTEFKSEFIPTVSGAIKQLISEIAGLKTEMGELKAAA